MRGFLGVVLGAWLGIIIFFSFGVTPALFGHYGREVAGDIVGHLFPRYYWFNYGAGFLAIILAGFVARTNRIFWAGAVLVVLAVLSIGVMEFLLAPAMEAVRGDADRAAFQRLHGIAMLLNLFSMVAVAVASVIFVRRVRLDSEGIGPG